VLLIITAPVGLVFGLIATRGLIHRLQILARATTAFAEGDFSQRVPVRLNDEIGQLEQHFNEMADRVNASLHAQRNLAAQNARLAERSRISRELHDSISQDLFFIANACWWSSQPSWH
jgi:HAMP domain-containing protein